MALPIVCLHCVCGDGYRARPPRWAHSDAAVHSVKIQLSSRLRARHQRSSEPPTRRLSRPRMGASRPVRLRIAKLHEQAHDRPAGYVHDIISRGSIDGDFLEITPESLAALRAKYRPPVSSFILHPFLPRLRSPRSFAWPPTPPPPPQQRPSPAFLEPRQFLPKRSPAASLTARHASSLEPLTADARNADAGWISKPPSARCPAPAASGNAASALKTESLKTEHCAQRPPFDTPVSL